MIPKLKVTSPWGLPLKEGEPRKLAIPEEVVPIFKRLQAKYDLDIEKVDVGGRPYYFLHVADLTPLLTGDVFGNAPEFPFWVKIWEASVILADHIAKLPPDDDRRILEVGAGMSLPGMVAASQGHSVTVTDYEEEILDFVRVSAAMNRCGSNLECRRLDWFEPEEMGQFEIILASEVAFHERFFQPLIDVLKNYLAPGGVIFMAHAADRETLFPFFKLCSEDFQIGMQKKRFRRGDKDFDVLLTRLKMKSH